MVGSAPPKLSPETVKDACPLCGEFLHMSDTTALSKLNCLVSEPTIALTLTAVRTTVPTCACGAHATAVADVHAVLLHTSAAVSSDAVTVGLEVAKLSPLIVTVPPPLGKAFAAAALTTGAAERIQLSCILWPCLLR
jgi:hypothetical protein